MVGNPVGDEDAFVAGGALVVSVLIAVLEVGREGIAVAR